MIKRLLIANRGEIAIRIIAACRELGIRSLAVYSEADAAAAHVVAADEAICIGPPPARESYLSIPAVVRAAQALDADAVHPGYGFLSENAAFAAACESAGIVFVGPPAGVIARMGSKVAARRLMEEAGVPIVPGETPEDQSDQGVGRAIDRVGLPVLVKASAGGGGKGMRRITDASGARDAIQAARREAMAAFGDGTLYVEKLIERPHHIEVQVMADVHGEIVHVFERECSVQRRHQKVIEESPSPAIDPDLRARITEAGVRAAHAAGYRNAGTVEFLVDVSGEQTPFYFLEMNTRLQVEHPVTELTAGVDLVRAQLLVASGEPLPWRQDAIAPRGHAIEARVYAEDPAQGFIPQAGRIAAYREPRMPGLRIDSGVTGGSEVPVFYDPLLAKVIAWAETRPLAIARLSAALGQFVIEGITTNVPFLRAILEHPAFGAGTIDTGFLDREATNIVGSTAALPTPPTPPAPPAPPALPALQWWDPWSGESRGRIAAPSATPSRPRRRVSAEGAQSLAAPMPATVVKVLVKPGDRVAKGDTVIVLEAMKMELPLRAAGDATVKAVHCREGELVQPDVVLIELD